MTSRKIKAQPRKAPRQARATATVEAILPSAAETFGRDGLARANINVIAERAGVSVGSLYQYFPSKEAVLVALIKQHTDEVLSKLEAVLGDVAGLPIDLAVRRVVTAMIAAHSAPFHRMLTRELDELGRLDSIQSTIDARGIDAVLSFLEARRDEIAVPDLELAAFILVRTVDLLTHAAVTDRPSILEGDVLATELSAIVLGYLVGGRAPRSP